MSVPTTKTTTRRDGPLAIHLGDNIGYCYGGKPLVWFLPKHATNGQHGSALFDALADFWALQKASKIAAHVHLDTVEDPEVAKLLAGLLICVEVFADRMEVPVQLVRPSALQQALFQDTDMPLQKLRTTLRSFAKRRGLSNLDYDAAHALALWEYVSKTDQKAIVGEVKAA